MGARPGPSGRSRPIAPEGMAPPVAVAPPEGTAPPVPLTPRHHRTVGSVARATLSAILIVLGVLSLVLSPVAIWGRNLVLNTNHYVETVAPLVKNPGVQEVIVNQVDKQVQANLDVAAYVKQVLPPRAANLLAAPVQSAVYGLVRTLTTKVVQSKAFYTLWVTINRVAHKQIVTLVTGRTLPGQVVVIRSGKIYLDLSQVVGRVKNSVSQRRCFCGGEAPRRRSHHPDRPGEGPRVHAERGAGAQHAGRLASLDRIGLGRIRSLGPPGGIDAPSLPPRWASLPA